MNGYLGRSLSSTFTRQLKPKENAKSLNSRIDSGPKSLSLMQ